MHETNINSEVNDYHRYEKTPLKFLLHYSWFFTVHLFLVKVSLNFEEKYCVRRQICHRYSTHINRRCSRRQK